MAEKRTVHLPPGFAAEVIAAACLAAEHVGGNNAGYDVKNDDYGEVQVKSCDTRRAGLLEFLGRHELTGACKQVVLVTTSKATAETTATAVRDGEDIVIETATRISRRDGGVRTYLISAARLDEAAVLRPEENTSGRWQVAVADCEPIDLPV